MLIHFSQAPARPGPGFLPFLYSETLPTALRTLVSSQNVISIGDGKSHIRPSSHRKSGWMVARDFRWSRSFPEAGSQALTHNLVFHWDKLIGHQAFFLTVSLLLGWKEMVLWTGSAMQGNGTR